MTPVFRNLLKRSVVGQVATAAMRWESLTMASTVLRPWLRSLVGGTVAVGMARFIGTIAIGVCLLGCVEGRKSTHELEHQVPAHWPVDLADAASKIEDRVKAVENSDSDDTPRKELAEIISWLPEVAADTAMREATWNEVNLACQRIKTMLDETSGSQLDGVDIRELCVWLRELHDEMLPKDDDPANG